MTDIGNVHHVTDAISDQLQSPPQNIGIEKRAKIADMRIVVDRWAAGIESDCSPCGIDGREDFGLTGEGVVEGE